MFILSDDELDECKQNVGGEKSSIDEFNKFDKSNDDIMVKLGRK